MTRLIARIILAGMLLPLAVAVMLLTIFLLDPRSGPSVYFGLAVWSVVATFVGVYWWLIWRDLVRWTRRRALLTVAAALGGVAAVGLAYGGLMGIGRGISSPEAMLVSGVSWPMAWIVLSTFAWRETAAERAERLRAATSGGAISCPLCGYNLTGLREPRCPECGASFTLDELLLANRAQDAVELPE